MFKQLYQVLLIVSFCFSATVSLAGNDGRKVSSIQGKVVDGSTSEGLAGVTVEVEGTNIKVYTDFDGNFTLPLLPEGSYNLRSTYVSYNEVKLRNIQVKADSPSTIEMKLHSN